MNKKWSYVAAMMLTASCGCLFTGCIDNDEPYGIEQIRVATANLLEAKKAAVEAEASANNAAAEVAKIQAEIEKAKLEVEKIKAQAEAEAARLQAEAAAAKTQAEANRIQAEADRIIKETEMAAKEKQAEIDRYIAVTDDMINNANLAYEKLVYQWEQTKIQDAAAATTALFRAVDAAYQSYMSQLSVYNNLNKEYLENQRKLAAFELDLVWNRDKMSFESPRYDQKEILESAVARLEKFINNNQETIARYNNVKQEIEDATNGSDLEELLAKYTEQQKEVLAELDKANVEKQAIYLDNKALYDSRITLDKQIAEAGNARIAIKPYTFVPSAALKALGWNDDEIVGDDVSFSLNSLDNWDNPYDRAKRSLEYKLYKLKNMYLDENDVLWNQAKVNEMELQLKAADATFGKAEKAWQMAKTVYNMGGVPDAAALTGEADLEKAIAAYNATQASLDALSEANKNAQEAVDAAQEAYSKAWDAYYDRETSNSAAQTWNRAQDVYSNAMTEAWNTYSNTRTAAEKAKEVAENANWAEYNKKWRTYNIAEQEANIAISNWEKDPENATLKAAKDAAVKAQEDAWKIAIAAWDVKEAADAKAQAVYDETMTKARLVREKADDAAQTAYEAAHDAWLKAGGAAADQNEPAYQPVSAAWTALQNAQTAATKASDALRDGSQNMLNAYDKLVQANDKQNDAIGFPMTQGIPDRYRVEAYAYGWYNLNFPVASAPILYTDKGRYENARNLLIQKSAEAFGSLGIRYNGDNHSGTGIEIDEAFLVNAVTPEMANNYVRATVYSGLSDYECIQYYWMFEAYGDALWLKAKINIAKACIAEPNMGAEASKGVQAELDALEKSLADAEAAKQALVDQKDDVDKQIDALNADIDDKIADLNHVNNDLTKVIFAIKNGIARLQIAAVGKDDYDHWYADAFKEEIKIAQEAIENAEGQLDKAKYQLGQYEAGYKDLENPFKPYVDYLAAEVESQKEYVSLLKSHLEDVQAIYEKATKE